MKLNNTTCKNAKPKEKPYKLSDGWGMYLEIMPNGSKYWRLKYRFGGKEKRLAIGVYPRVSLKEARDKREEAKDHIASGKDPSLAKKEQKLQLTISTKNTFEQIAREWLKQRSAVITAKHSKTTMRRMEHDVFPYIGSHSISDITPPMLLEVVRKVERRGAHEISQRNLQTCGQIFRYAIQTGRAERDISADLKGALAPLYKEPLCHD